MLLSRGNKASEDDGDIAELDATRTVECLENLKTLLGLERVTLSVKTSKGIYERDKNRVKIVSAIGKWNIGYYENKVNYLKPHEALFQIEIRKLEVTFDSVIMSIEQAYAIFLDPKNEFSFEEYLVYVQLSRVGYFVEQHNPAIDKQKYETIINKRTLNNEDEMIWTVLKEKLDLPVSSQFINDEFELYEQTKASMKNICKSISGDQGESYAGERTTKRCLSPGAKREDEISSKRHKLDENEYQEQNFLDILKVEVEFFTYQEIFKKFSFIKRHEDVKKLDRQLKFNFDVFLPKPNRKRTEDLPSYRIVVVK